MMLYYGPLGPRYDPAACAGPEESFEELDSSPVNIPYDAPDTISLFDLLDLRQRPDNSPNSNALPQNQEPNCWIPPSGKPSRSPFRQGRNLAAPSRCCRCPHQKDNANRVAIRPNFLLWSLISAMPLVSGLPREPDNLVEAAMPVPSPHRRTHDAT